MPTTPGDSTIRRLRSGGQVVSIRSRRSACDYWRTQELGSAALGRSGDSCPETASGSRRVSIRFGTAWSLTEGVWVLAILMAVTHSSVASSMIAAMGRAGSHSQKWRVGTFMASGAAAVATATIAVGAGHSQRPRRSDGRRRTPTTAASTATPSRARGITVARGEPGMVAGVLLAERS